MDKPTEIVVKTLEGLIGAKITGVEVIGGVVLSLKIRVEDSAERIAELTITPQLVTSINQGNVNIRPSVNFNLDGPKS